MSESEQPQAETQSQQEDRPDPKEAMRQALERKKHNEHFSSSHGVGPERGEGHAHGKVGGKREFRRKSG